MTRLARRDGVATLLVAAVILCYVGHLTGSMPFVRTPNGMAAIGLILGFVACVVGGWSGGVEAPTVDRLPATMGILTATVGLTVLVTANSWLLALFMAGVSALWVLTTLTHAGVVSGRHRAVDGPVPLGAEPRPADPAGQPRASHHRG